MTDDLTRLAFTDLNAVDILNNLDVGIAVFDARGNYLFVNTVMIKLRGISREEFLRRNVHDFIPVLSICVFDLVCEKKGKVIRLQYYQNSQNQTTPPRVRLVTGSPIFDENGEIKYVVMLLQDIRDFNEQYRSLLAQGQTIESTIIENPERTPGDRPVVAVSPEIRQLLTLAENIARLDSTVLLFGESGTGKEVFANYIHSHSPRADHRMITVNCASIPDNLMEAELFGYEKGSFTGASREGKTGLVEEANGSTLFLDEINSLPLPMQGKILRMIEEKSIQRIGSVKTRKVDFRLIAATNRDLSLLVQNGEFREDLYYRLNVIPLTIPPIRNRKADVVPLCEFFLDHFCKKYNLHKTFSANVYDQIRDYNWPGNVREIRNFVERMVVMTPYLTTEINSIPDGVLTDRGNMGRAASFTGASVSPFTEQQLPVRDKRTRRSRADALTREDILNALSVTGGHRQKAADYLGISRRYLQSKIREFRISDRCRYKEPSPPPKTTL